MGIIAYIRQIYLDADHYKMAKADLREKSSRVRSGPTYDRALEGVLESPRVLLPVNRRIDIDRMLRFAAELKMKAVLYGPVEGYRAADLLKNKQRSGPVNLKWPEKARDTDPEEERHACERSSSRDNAPGSAAIFAKNGVKFAFYSGGLERRSRVCCVPSSAPSTRDSRRTTRFVL